MAKRFWGNLRISTNPEDTKLVHRMQRSQACSLRLSSLKRCGYHSTKASIIHQGAPPEARASRPETPAERTLQGHAGSNLDSPTNVTTLVIGHRQASWESCSTHLPPHPPTLLCLSHVIYHWAPSLGGVLPEVRGIQTWEERGTGSGRKQEKKRMRRSRAGGGSPTLAGK